MTPTRKQIDTTTKQTASAICNVVKVASELRAEEGREAELHERVRAVMAQRSREPQLLEAHAAPDAEIAEIDPAVVLVADENGTT